MQRDTRRSVKEADSFINFTALKDQTNSLSNKQEKAFSVFTIICGVALLTYLLLRAFLVEPLHDEVATFYHFIEFGTIWGDDTIVDANNHLLNSYLSRGCYLLFGDHFWALRLPNIFGFILFFWAVVKLTKYLPSNLIKYIFVISCTCIPYVLDYFAYTRGYGLSMGFLLASVYSFLNVNEHYKFSRMFLLAIFVICGIYANLNLMITGILIFGYIGIKQIILLVSDKNYKQFIGFVLIGIATIIALLPALDFAMHLKEVGALYYGNKDGLWLTTGVTLSQNILFSTATFIKYALIILLLLFIAHLLYTILSKGVKAFFEAPSTLWIGLLIGNLLAIETMRWLLDTNYPEDRVGMHLIFLFIGAAIFTFQNYRVLTWVSVIFLIFPIVGWKHFNLTTSVFTPDERMEKKEYELYTQNMNKDKSAAIYTTQKLTYAYHTRQKKSSFFQVPSMFSKDMLYSEEIVSSKKDPLINKNRYKYDILHQNENTKQQILIRKETILWKKVQSPFTTGVFPVKTADLYYNLLDTSWTTLQTNKIKLVIECTVQFSSLARETLGLVTDQTKNSGENYYDSFNLNWVNSSKNKFTFRKVLELEPAEIKDLKLYLFNPNQFEFTIHKQKIDVFVAEKQ